MKVREMVGLIGSTGEALREWCGAPAYGTLAPVAGAMGGALLRTERSGTALRWLPAAAKERFLPDRVFLQTGWAAHWRSPGGFLPLELVDGGRRVALLTVRDLWLPGVFRLWDLPAEPQALADGVSQADALAALLRLARLNRVDRVQSWSNMARWTDPALRPLLAGGQVEPFGTYLLDLQRPFEQVYDGLHSKHRYQVRKAESADLRVEPSVAPEAFYDLLSATYARGSKGHAFGRGYLRCLIGAPRVPLLAFSAWSGGTLQAAILVPWDRRRGYFLHGATHSQPVMGSSVLVHLAAIRALQSLGVAAYDLGGARRQTEDARLAGIFRFKERFGGVFEDCLRWRIALTRVGRLPAGSTPAPDESGSR